MPNSTLKAWQFILAISIALGLLIPYEWFWRVQEGFPQAYDLENLDYWADWRKKLDQLDSNDVVIIGSSRAHFDINIHLWDSITGRKPIMLAYPGGSPHPIIQDVIKNSDFTGTLVVGVAPGLFFTHADGWSANRARKLVNNYENRTYAKQFNHFLYQYLDPQLSYINEGLSYKSLVERLPFPNRDSVETPLVWPPMVAMDEYRNIRMLDRMEHDTAIQNLQKKIWSPKTNMKNRIEDQLDTIMFHYVNLSHQFQSRGGKLVYIRAPVTGDYAEHEPLLFPRKEYWDRLIQESKANGYHFLDYDITKNMDPPEWSHLSKEDSDIYTRWLVQQLQKDKLL